MRLWHDLHRVDDLSVFYNKDYYDSENVDVSEGYGGYYFKRLAAGFQSKIKDVKAYCGEGRLLDVGCAKGFFIKFALDAGFDAYGIDFSRYAIEHAKNLVGHRAMRADIEKKVPFCKQSFDVITAWDLVEHLKSPEDFFHRMNLLLKDGGYLFLTTLNYNSLMGRLMRENWRFKASLHISYTITPKKLQRWLRTAGFRITSSSTFCLNLKPLPKKLKFFERSLSSTLILATPFLKALNLGDIIRCVAQKELTSQTQRAEMAAIDK